ncbi:hypothetical protein JTE90_012557 [Oedothorax gibbosus]|uniref:Uncharacterized protein n=1 Tax=Oedothorax gibbosus TaxID=931172 RepID=A0AAV6TXJ1_9ARAC|nr:hypothetical protein JTE90_012557 [Oedothorax gibbosus]
MTEDPGPDPAQDVAIVDRGVGLIAAIVEMTGHVPEARRNEQANPRVALEARAETETETKNTGNLAVEAGAILLNNLWGTSSEVGLKAPNLKVEQQTDHLRKLSEKDDYCSAFLFKGAVVCCNWCGEQWQSHGAVVSSGVLSSSRERQVPGIKIRVPA